MNCPTTPPAVSRSVAGAPVQRGQAAAREQHEREAADAHRGVGARAAFLVVALPEHHEAGDAQHDGEQIGRPAEQEEQDVATATRRKDR